VAYKFNVYKYINILRYF